TSENKTTLNLTNEKAYNKSRQLANMHRVSSDDDDDDDDDDKINDLNYDFSYF
ncbi:unnamed protein product, partial [Rotaria magnacalcarata]